jgi:hypothetical protein
MSPVEAMYIAMDLVYQKIHLEEFQVSPREFRANLNKKRQKLWETRKTQDGGGREQQENTEPSFQVQQATPSSRSTELKGMSARVASIKPAEFLSLLKSSLQTLGIDN